MVKAKIKLKNPTGLHLRPAGILCNEAVKFGDEIEFICDGKDEEEALSAMLKIVDDGLGE